MSRATELADQLEALDKGALTSMWAREGDKAVVAELRRLDRVNAELWDIEPQVTHVKFGPEPSLRKVLKAYYRLNGIHEDAAAEMANDYIAALTSSGDHL
jgi:hypothetical protein